ncbi:DASH family cryptochrome [Photobacterium swingsii]|uniref:DASH family cryptochrome n=1 Tax=Photobacterium swingsii TaxID=680026 RepID=UPI0040693804
MESFIGYKHMMTGLFLFQNDLRLHDNRALSLAAQEVDRLVCVYCFPYSHSHQRPFSVRSIGQARQQFLLQSLACLNKQLTNQKQVLLILFESPLTALPSLITRFDIAALYRSENAGYYENKEWQLLEQRYPFLHFTTTATHTLFDQAELPFELSNLPVSFSKFRKLIESQPIQTSLDHIGQLPPPPSQILDMHVTLPIEPQALSHHSFYGGETAGLEHLQRYFASQQPSHYKQTRNALDDWQSSTKFSPWLALGCLSARKIIEALDAYHNSVERNSSTEWIKFELLWREYFQWYAHCYQKDLFMFKGIKNKAPHTSYYSERFRRWCTGNTPYPIVNACMKQLNLTGYMSNRGRQLAASCLVHELSVDWRYGASYFEQHLLDYDVASNWGNWQYIAGVGADPREHRHFNLQKQTEQYDPSGIFIRKWQGNTSDGNLDAVDAADWPLHPE